MAGSDEWLDVIWRRPLARQYWVVHEGEQAAQARPDAVGTVNYEVAGP